MYKGQNSIRVEDLNISSVVVKAKIENESNSARSYTLGDIPLCTSLCIKIGKVQRIFKLQNFVFMVKVKQQII